MENTPGIIDSKRPMDLTPGVVPGLLPGKQLRTQGPLIQDAALETLTRQNTDLNLGHVEPGAVRWGEMKT